MSEEDQTTAQLVFDRYVDYYDGEIQGCCLLIADEIQRKIGGELVAGEIAYGGTGIRTHWWVEKDGEIVDPMFAHFFCEEDYPKRTELHRDRRIFDQNLPNYEQWRVAESWTPSSDT
jgi:hypothetical protein